MMYDTEDFGYDYEFEVCFALDIEKDKPQMDGPGRICTQVCYMA